MSIPEQLAVELAVASSAIDESGELPSAVRKEVLQLVEKLSFAEHANAGYLRRARLAIICAREVLEHLSRYPARLMDARSILTKGMDALSGKYELRMLQQENGAFHTTVVDLLELGEEAFRSAYAGLTVVAAINTILYDTNFDLLGENEKTIPPDDWDVSYYGSLAASGSAIWEGKGGAENRRAYWRWYLDYAIPRAWDVFAPLNAT